MNKVEMHVVRVNSNEQLATMCQQIVLHHKEIAVDTEFIRRTSFYPHAALFQIAVEDTVFLIDPLSIDHWDALTAILASPEIVKIMHACWEDIEVFQYFLGCLPKNVIDTQLALAFANVDWSMGYHRMVKHLLNKDLEKSATLSDWLKRPLSTNQLRYASEDVEFLLDCYRILKKQLVAEDKWRSLEQQCDELLQKFTLNLNTKNYYKKIKAVYELTHKQQAIMQLLCQWREELAQKKNKPRAWVISDKTLLRIALFSGHYDDLQVLLKSSKVDMFSDDIYAILQRVETSDSEAWPDYLAPKIKLLKGSPLLKWRNCVENIASKAGIVQQLLLSKDEFISCFIRGDANQWEFAIPETWPEWKTKLIATDLKAWVNSVGNF